LAHVKLNQHTVAKGSDIGRKRRSLLDEQKNDMRLYILTLISVNRATDA
jgi:hypothetical protein